MDQRPLNAARLGKSRAAASSRQSSAISLKCRQRLASRFLLCLLLVPAPLCELAFSFSSFSFPSLLNKQGPSGNEYGDNIG